eukprot:gene27425-55519_t
MGISGGKERPAAPHLRDFFDAQKAEKQRVIEKKTDAMQAVMLAAMEAEWEKDDERLTARLRPHIERAFDRHDRDGDKMLMPHVPQEAQAFFAHFVAEAERMVEALTATVLDAALADSLRYLHSSAGRAVREVAVLRGRGEGKDWDAETRRRIEGAKVGRMRELRVTKA